MTLGEKIRTLRMSNNLSQKELANKLNITTGNIAEWESDEAVPTLGEIAKLSAALGTPTDSLLIGREFPETCDYRDCKTDAKNQHLNFADMSPEKKNRKQVFWWIAGAVLVLVTIVCIVFFAQENNSKSETTTQTVPVAFSENVEAIEIAASSVVKIYCYDLYGNETATGSGFVAYNDHTIVTNYHVLSEAYSCKISTDQDITFMAKELICYSQEVDVAVIRLEEGTGLTPLEFGNASEIKKGEKVVAIGSPLGVKNSVSQGVLSSRIMENAMDILQFTAPISSGSSGGALFDDRGKVIGVTYASYEEGQNMNLAIPINEVERIYTESASKKAQPIYKAYFDAYPWMMYIEEYQKIRDAESVTLSTVKNDPQYYDGKMIQLDGMVVGFDEYGWPYLAVEGLDPYGYAKEIKRYESQGFEDSTILYTTLTSRCLYEPAELEIGDKVIVHGEFYYRSIGEKYKAIVLKDGVFTTEKTATVTYAELDAYVVYKANDMC